MEKSIGNEASATKDLFLLLFILVVLFIVWASTGGPEREAARSGVFIKPPAPVDTGETYGSLSILGTGKADGQTDETTGAFSNETGKGAIRIVYLMGAQSSNPQKEYIELRADTQNTAPALLSGLRLQNRAGFGTKLPEAVAVPLFGSVNQTAPAFLSPDERAYITTGNSPVGMSFRVNRCSGYLEQFRDFTPALPQSCPSPLEGVDRAAANISAECAQFISRIPRCTIVTAELPDELTPSCKEFILGKIGHNSCAAAHQNDANFYTGEWRIFLGIDRNLWGDEGDIIQLIDRNGSTIDSVIY
ncbi:MAG: hypothetical protein COW88_01970 [Candidatus Lloydbacteria bacterium CG22_combo_CG10-13_8_21_14_all_47_15]|uniref:Uncharacterized protein n=1 Tax=Candidatus Lloydbacteria bacterium CG22_combo_CG10-13_8_21_14_all_47_15 TaxID=1974635 RepID=A0A2H0CU69_9BACT|nr:MAG: hypothetical protein COW88_01970 [Candidatus Lloydbacteria bacterium CG22_combo_CG10-13_8_21_14_all_47_15]